MNSFAGKYSRQGIALLLVIATLALLAIIVIPFSVSMRIERREALGFSARFEARLGARTALAHAKASLVSTDRTSESSSRAEPPFDTPQYDLPSESSVWMGAELRGKLGVDAAGRGRFITARAQDAAGLIDLNRANFSLLGNLLASTVVSRNLPQGETAVLEVESTRGFPDAGLLFVNGELIGYQFRSETGFEQLTRAVLNDSRPFEYYSARMHAAGTHVIDARAYKIAKYPLRDPSRWQPFRTVEEVRRIADLGSSTLSRSEFNRIAPYLTVRGWCEDVSTWTGEQFLRNTLPSSSALNVPDVLRVDRIDFVYPGSVVRIQEGGREAYGLVRGVQSGQLALHQKLGIAFTTAARVSVLSPIPVQVNSAPPKVLVALLSGIRGTGSVVVTHSDALRVTREILSLRDRGEAIRGPVHLSSVLDSIPSDEMNPSIKNSILVAGQHPGGAPATYTERRGRRGGGTIGWQQASRLRQTTAPFSYAAGRLFWIEGTSWVSGDAGAERSRQTLRQLVALPAMGGYSVGTQSGFRRSKEFMLSSWVVTGPRFLGARSSLQLPEQGEPGTVGLLPMPLPGREHFAGSHQGRTIQRSQGLINSLATSGGQLAPGVIQFWFSPRSRGEILLDSGTGDVSDRLSLVDEGSALSFKVYDVTLEAAYAETRANRPLPLGQWSHVDVAWNSTAYGGLSLLIDGWDAGTEFAYRTGDGGPLSARLAGSLSASSRTITLDRNVDLPAQGVVQIGTEVIEYERISGRSLTVRTSTPGFSSSRRNRAGTAPMSHASGTPVLPYGYAIPVTSDLQRGGGSLSEDLDPLDFTLVNVPIGQPLPATDTIIPVQNTSAFPSEGFALLVRLSFPGIRFEYVSYTGKSSNSLSGCQRGQLGTLPRTITQGSYVIPCSVAVDNASDYPASGSIQIDDEWINYSSIQMGRFFIYESVDMQSIQSQIPQLIQDLANGVTTLDQILQNALIRARDGTLEVQHRSGTQVEPVFTVGGNATSSEVGRFDSVTLIEGNALGSRLSMTVNWVSGNRVAFRGWVSRTYAASGGSRLLKFPTGELPYTGGAVFFGGPASGLAGGTCSGVIDELRSGALAVTGGLPLASGTGISASDSVIQVSSTTGLSATGGIVKIGDEYVGYTGLVTQAGGGVLQGCIRGYLGSSSGAHAGGALVFPQSHLVASALTSGLGADDNALRVSSVSGYSNEGYVRVGAEMVGYTRRSQGVLWMPSVDSKGIFRGAFGTSREAHSAGSLVYQMPFRYPDRFALEYDGPELAYYTMAVNRPGSWFRTLRFGKVVDSNRLEVVALARFDGSPSWASAPTNRPGGLWLFEGADTEHELGIQADEMEIRFMFRYRNGSYQAGDWKRSPLLNELAVSTSTPERVYHNQEGR